jgi:hypothetical protein
MATRIVAEGTHLVAPGVNVESRRVPADTEKAVIPRPPKLADPVEAVSMTAWVPRPNAGPIEVTGIVGASDHARTVRPPMVATRYVLVAGIGDAPTAVWTSSVERTARP